jgi:enamidase
VTKSSFPLRTWVVLALLLPNLPLPFYAALGYESGGIHEALEFCARWLSFAALYWLPVGWLALRPYPRRIIALLIAYACSVPLFLLCLWIVYPLAGTRFHPSSGPAWGIYFSATVWFFLLVAALAWFAAGRPWRRISLLAVSALLFLAGTIGPTFLIFGTDRLRWPAERAQTLNIVNCSLIDLPSGQVISGKNVHIRDGRIVGIVDAAGDRFGEPILNAAGGYLLPGLIDVHTHLDAPMRSVTEPFDFSYMLDQEFSRMADHRRAYLDAGVTAVRDCGGPAMHTFAWRAAIDNHQVLGPRLFAVGRVVTSPHGHPVATIWKSFPYLAREGAVLATSSDNLEAGLNHNERQGPADAVKFIYGTIGRAKEMLSPALLADGIRWARAHHKISVVHTETVAEIRDAVEDGATGVEHVATAGEIPSALAEEMAQKGTFADPTFGEFKTALQLTSVPADEQQRRLADRYAAIRKLASAGVRLVIGTDAPLVPFGAGFLDELDHFKRAGFSPVEILTFATVNNAAYLGQGGKLGCLNPGCYADLVLLSASPLDSLSALRKPKEVLRDGIPVLHP